MKFSKLAFCVAASGLSLSGPAFGQQILGALDGVVDQQLQRGWFAGEQDGWFVMRNDTLEKSEQTLTIKAGPPSAAGRRASVNVSISSDQPTAAIGMVVRNSANKGTCVAELTAEAAANLFCVIDGKFESVATVAKAAKLDGTDVIDLIETPGLATFIVNGKLLGDVPNAAALGDELGVMAFERGTFGVAEFMVTDMEDSAPPLAQGSGLPPRGGSAGASAPADAPATTPPPAGSDANATRMAEIMGPLATSIIGSGNREGWGTFFENEWLVLVNENKASSENFFTMPMGGPVASGERVVKVNVNIRPPQGRTVEEFKLSAAGIVVESATTKNSCLGEITLGGDGLVLCFGEDGKSTEIGRLPGAAKVDGTDLLEWVEQPGVGGFFLNGKLIAQVNEQAILGGAVGILAYERGDFYFSDFAVSTTNAAAPQTTGTSAAPPPTSSTGEGAIPFINTHESQLIGAYLGVTNGIFMHEFGHALIAELQLPSTGPEEDAVDIFSALRVVEPTMYPSGDENIDLIGREVAIYSVLPWYYGGMINSQTGEQLPWQDEHTGDLRRFRNTFCVIYGGNPGLYEHIAEQVGMEERTLSRCAEEFNRQNRAWRTILAPHTRISTWHPDGHLMADAPGAAVKVTFELPTTPVSRFLVETFEDGLRGFAEDLAKTYVLPRDLSVTYRQCGELNAWYNPSEGSITMCYDLIEYLIGMLAEVELGGTQTSSAPPAQADTVAVTSEMMVTAGALNELADYGVPATSVLFPAPYRGPTPAAHMRADVLTTPAIVDLLTGNDNWLLVDTSGGTATLPGAFAVVDAGRDGSLTDRFQGLIEDWLTEETGGDKSVPIIFFGAGMQDRSSYNAALRAGMAGWKAYWYRGGIEAWRSNGLPMAGQID